MTLTHKSPGNQLRIQPHENAVNAVLGNLANISSVREKSTTKTPARYTTSPAQNKRKTRFKLLDAARHILRENNVTTSRSNNPHRTRHCLAVRYDNTAGIGITLNADSSSSSAGLENLVTCGSICSCPVCAHKKMMEYAHDIKKALEYAKQNNLMPVMLTLTARHYRNYRLETFVSKFKSAWRYFANGRVYRGIKRDYGIEHSITAREVTRQRTDGNGWHYHMHILLFLDKSQVLDNEAQSELENMFADRWMTALERERLTGIPDIACKLSAGANVGEQYLTKLGITHEAKGQLEYEMTGSENKGATVWDILKDASNGCEECKQLYLEYVQVMTGENWITFSHGFRALIENIELLDDDNQDDDRKLFYEISQENWTKIVLNGAVGELLDIAATYRSIDMIQKFIRIIRNE